MKRMLNQICMGLGGRVAEELVMNDISSGAAGDIKTITKIARHMVCDWGMSPLGTIAYGDNQDTVFLGREITRTENVSEDTARLIDAEIHRIISEQHDRASKIIGEHRPALDKIAEALLEFETIEGRHVLEILEHGELRSPIAIPRARGSPAHAGPRWSQIPRGSAILSTAGRCSPMIFEARECCSEMIRWISASISRAVSSDTFSVRVISRPRNTVRLSP